MRLMVFLRLFVFKETGLTVYEQLTKLSPFNKIDFWSSQLKQRKDKDLVAACKDTVYCMKKAHFNKESCIKVVGEYKEVPLD